MFKLLLIVISSLAFLNLNAQTIPSDFKPPKTENSEKLGGLDKKEHKIFNNINHPLSVTGGGLTLAGAALYIIGSETLKKKPIDNPFLDNYSPQTSLQYIGIGVFAAGAVLFVIFSTEREKGTKRKKGKKKYDASDWEIAIE